MSISLYDPEINNTPLQLINFEDNKFELSEEAANIINKIEDDLIVVSIIGKARTGKSYLMNLLLDNIGKDNTFQVGSTISSCTKGIWLWGNYRTKANGSAKIIFIDSEGLSAIDRSTKTYDAKIFALVVLLSSLFIYNSTSNIDEHGISELSLAAHISNAIATESNYDKDTVLNELAPKFIWVLRDFTLEKVHPETGEEISSKEYLEVCLKKKISGKNSKENNIIRENILKYFQDRDCVTLVRPTESESDLRNLNNIPFNDLKTAFKLEFMELKKKIFREAQPKRIKGKVLNGPAFVNLLNEFLKAINTGVVPNINNAWDSVINNDIKAYFLKSQTMYKEGIKSLKYKTLEENLLKHLFNIKLASLMNYAKILNLNQDTFVNDAYYKIFNEYRINLEIEIRNTERKIYMDYENETTKINQEIVRKTYNDINNKILNSEYSLDKSEIIIEDHSKFYSEYDKEAYGPHKLKVFTMFISEREEFLIKLLIETSKKSNINSLNKQNKQITMIEVKYEELKNQNNLLKEKDNINSNRIKNFENDLNRRTEEYENLLETLKNLEKELSMLNGSPSTTAKVTNTEENIQIVKPPKNKRKATGDSSCKCLLF